MFNFLIILFFVLIEQIIFVASFATAVGNAGMLTLIPFILLALYLALYIPHSKEVCKILKLDKELFNAYFILSWILVGILITCVVFLLLHKGLLPTSGDIIFSGLEYILVPMLLIGYLLLLNILKSIIVIISKTSKKIK